MQRRVAEQQALGLEALEWLRRVEEEKEALAAECSALRSREPPECMPRLLAATVSTKEAVRLSCSPTLVAAWRPAEVVQLAHHILDQLAERRLRLVGQQRLGRDGGGDGRA